jgi:uncharacterized protein YbjT (DUF2867 family)
LTTEKKILLTGATGYVGGRLRTRLEQAGHDVYLLTRRPEALAGRDGCTILAGDLLDATSLPGSVPEFDVAFYMVHAMGDKGNFREKERLAARNFAEWAVTHKVGRVVYLGGLGDSTGTLSPHLRSRQETGEILREHGLLVIELRASIILGSGSLSFELIRALVERLPVMLCPKWVRVKAQPIAIENVLQYLEESISLDVHESSIYEIGGPDQVSYGDIMRAYADARGLKRRMLPVPLLTPFLSSLWLGLVTPVFARIGRKLIEGVRYPTVVSDHRALDDFSVQPLSLKQAIERALVNEDREFAETRWSDALSSGGHRSGVSPISFSSRRLDARNIHVPVSPDEAFAVIERIGGDTGWYFWDWIWWLRGFIDLLVGGVGVRRGRRDPLHLEVGDALDFWRVEEIVHPERLRLRAEMKLPGRAWLEFEVRPTSGGSTIFQTALFDPMGVWGRIYWYGLYPIHAIVFRRMLKNIARATNQ